MALTESTPVENAPRAIVPYQQQKLEIPVRPRRFGNAEIAQKAKVERIEILFNIETDVTAVIVHTVARCFDEAGHVIPASRMPWEKVPLVADNNTLVDLETGEQILVNTKHDPESPLSWLEQMQQSGRRLMRQGDLFQKMFFDKEAQVASLAEIALSNLYDANAEAFNRYDL